MGLHHISSEWLAYIGDFSHLQSLSVIDAPRLKDKALLSALPRLTSSLTELDLSGCCNISRGVVEAVGKLTRMERLALTGTGIRSPYLAGLSGLTGLTALLLGSCDVAEDDVTRHMSRFKHLRQLDLWGALVGDAAVQAFHLLPFLRSLNLGWSQVHLELPLFSHLTFLDLSHCQLEGVWEQLETTDAAAAAQSMQLQQLVLRQARLSVAGLELLETAVR
eukprot:gene11042-11197_t